MSQTILEMAKDLVMAQIQAGTLPLDEMHKALQKTYANLAALRDKEEMRDTSATLTRVSGEDLVAESEGGTAASQWKKSIKKHSIECLICGTAFKQLSIRHLKEHGLDAQSYRARFGIPRAQPLSAKDTTATRKKIVQESRPWEKAPTYIKAQNQKAAESGTTRVGTRTRRSTTAGSA